jgi:predicted ABC-type ATPase
MRMFAGPNGSGKSSLKEVLPEALQGVYLNPDEIEASIKDSGLLDLNHFGLTGAGAALERRLKALQRPGHGTMDDLLIPSEEPNVLNFHRTGVDSYLASALVEIMREALLEQGANFTFETVMSHPSKVEILRRARDSGFRTYLYFVATEDVEINVSRVANRVELGGHPVPEEKIRSRYWRSLDLLFEAIQHTDRAYVFDNSRHGSELSWIAEVTDGKEIEFKTSLIQHWFKVQVLDKIRP